MFGYIVRRLLAAVVVLFLVTFLSFALFFKGPSNPAVVLCQQNSRCTPEKEANIEAALGWDKGLLWNYKEFVRGLVQDRVIDMGAPYDCDAPCLGLSFKGKTEISKDLVTYYPATLSLAIGAGILYLLIGVPVGILAARYRGSFYDKFLVGLTQVVSSIPYYIMALTAFIYLTLKTSIFPPTGYNSFLANPATWAAGLLLPWLILGLSGAPNYARYTRGQMLETMGEDYVRSAKAKGLSSRSLLYKHSLRAAIVPIVTLFGLDFAFLLSGTIFTEAIFQIQGIGQWTLNSLKPPTDFPVLNATVMIFAVFVVTGNLIVDLLYAVLDPRVRLV